MPDQRHQVGTFWRSLGRRDHDRIVEIVEVEIGRCLVRNIATGRRTWLARDRMRSIHNGWEPVRDE